MHSCFKQQYFCSTYTIFFTVLCVSITLRAIVSNCRMSFGHRVFEFDNIFSFSSLKWMTGFVSLFCLSFALLRNCPIQVSISRDFCTHLATTNFLRAKSLWVCVYLIPLKFWVLSHFVHICQLRVCTRVRRVKCVLFGVSAHLTRLMLAITTAVAVGEFHSIILFNKVCDGEMLWKWFSKSVCHFI